MTQDTQDETREGTTMESTKQARITIDSKEYGRLNFSGVEEAREYVITFRNSGGEPARIAETIEEYLGKLMFQRRGQVMRGHR